jgi:hypothetical protein
MIGPQYHDNFFSDYYLYLEERNKLEHYYNKYGKRYTYDNPLSKTYSNKSWEMTFLSTIINKFYIYYFSFIKKLNLTVS